MNKIGQETRVIEYIKEFGSITRAEALTHLGVANLPAVIHTLRNRGNNIETEEVKGTNRYGDKVTYAKYTLQEEE